MRKGSLGFLEISIAFILVLTAGIAIAVQPALFPGIASVNGANNTVWRSEATFFNPTSDAQPVLLEIIPRGQASPAASETINLDPGATKCVEDIYSELQAGTGAGTLRVTGNLLSWVRTYNQAPQGTFGQDIPNVAVTGFPANQSVIFPVHTPADISKEFRSNFIIYNLDPATQTATLSVGGKQTTVSLMPGTYYQYDNVGAALGAATGDATLSVTSTGPWGGIVSSVDPVTGDPTTLSGQPWTAWVFNDQFDNLSGWQYDEHASSPGAGFTTSNGYLMVNAWGTDANTSGPVVYKMFPNNLDLRNEIFSIDYYYSETNGYNGSTYFEFVDADDVPLLSFGFSAFSEGGYGRTRFFITIGTNVQKSSDYGCPPQINGKVTFSASAGSFIIYYNNIQVVASSLTQAALASKIRLGMKEFNNWYAGTLDVHAMKIDWARMQR